MLYESSSEELHQDLERWVSQGLMKPRQAARIEALEKRRDRKEAAAAERSDRRRQLEPQL